MKLVKECLMCDDNVIEATMTYEQYVEYKIGKKSVQEIFPELKPEIREALISGICPECWAKIFKKEEE